MKTPLGYHRENNYLWLDADANEHKRWDFSFSAYFTILRIMCKGVFMCTQTHIHTDTHSQTHALRHTLTTGSFSSIYGQEMGVVLCLVELSNTILSHIDLTSNTSDKPILFLSTESSPCPKITLLSLGTQQRRMVSRGVDSSLWHLPYA